MQNSVVWIGVIFILALPVVLMTWGLWPLMTSRDSSAYRRFILADMYALVLQIAVTGATLSQIFRDDSRFLVLLVCSAFVLAMIWRFMVAALGDNGVGGNRERVVVLTVAPLQILFGPVVLWIGVNMLGKADIHPALPYVMMAAGILIPYSARRIYQWALRTKKPADVPPAVSES